MPRVSQPPSLESKSFGKKDPKGRGKKEFLLKNKV
jgi:hypothetical protein